MVSLKRSCVVLVCSLAVHGFSHASTGASPQAAVPAEPPAAIAPPNPAVANSVDPAAARAALALLAVVLASAAAPGTGDAGEAIERALARLWNNPNSQALVTRLIEKALTQSLGQPGATLDPETKALVRSVVQSAAALIRREVAAERPVPRLR